MTRIEFHFDAPDKLHYACRLLRKAAQSGARVWVTAEAATGTRLDNQLWGLSPTDFVPHCQETAQGTVQGRSAIVIATRAPSVAEPDANPTPNPFGVMLNLGSTIPPGYDRFARVIEVVSQDEGDRDQARQRWRQYKAQGYDIQRKDLKLRDGP